MADAYLQGPVEVLRFPWELSRSTQFGPGCRLLVRSYQIKSGQVSHVSHEGTFHKYMIDDGENAIKK
jgi:hypothetical protein